MINNVGQGANFNATFGVGTTTETKTETAKRGLLQNSGTGNTQGSSKETSTDTTEVPDGGTKLPDSGGTTNRIGSVSMADTISVMFMAAQQQREIGTKDRQMALEANVQNLLASSEKLMKAAQEKKDAAISAAVCQIAGGVISGVGGYMSMRVAQGSTDIAMEINAGATTKIFGMVADAVVGGGKIAEANQNYTAEVLTAKSKTDDAMAALQEKRYQEANDFRENAKQAQSAVMDYVRALAQSQVETEKAIARNL